MCPANSLIYFAYKVGAIQVSGMTALVVSIRYRTKSWLVMEVGRKYCLHAVGCVYFDSVSLSFKHILP